MTHKVDPFVVRIPDKISNDPELYPFFDYFVRWAHDMWVKVGGGQDKVSLPVNVATSAYTTEGSEIVIAAASITVTLESSPADETFVIVKRETSDGTVTIAGTIDNDTNYYMEANHEGIELVYSSTLEYWVIV